MLPQDFLFQLKQANPIEQVMGRYAALQRAGNLLKCCCPFHSEKTPSCIVYANTQDPHFYCFGCHVGGDVITFLMKIEGVSYIEAVEMLAENAGMTVPRDDAERRKSQQRMRIFELNRAAANYYYAQLGGADKRGLQYLANRGLKPETVKKYGLGFAGDRWDDLAKAMQKLGFSEEELLTANLCSRSARTGSLYDRFRNRVIFPIIDLRGSIIAFGGRTIEKDGEPKYLNSSDTPVYKKGDTLFSLNFAKKSQSKRLILAEGYLDVIAIHQAGFENVVATLGTALTPSQCRLMRQYCDEVIISYDSDNAGQTSARKAVNLLHSVGITTRILRMEGAKDPDEYIKKFGASRFRLLLEEADDAVSFQLEQCKNGLDINNVSEKNTALQKVTAVLADISNVLEREVYLSKVSKEYEIAVDAIRAQVNQELKKRENIRKKTNWRSLSTQVQMRDPVNPDANSHRREAKAEEQILCYLFRHPDALTDVLRLISPEEFVTDLNRRILVCFRDAIVQGNNFSLSIFSQQFSPSEMGHITGILARHDDIAITEKAVHDCAQLLKSNQPSPDSPDDISDEEWAAALKRKNSGKI